MLDRQNGKLMEEYKNQSIREGEMRILADKNKRDVQKKVPLPPPRSSSTSSTTSSRRSTTGSPRSCSRRTWLRGR